MADIKVGDHVEALVTESPYFMKGDTGVVLELNAGKFDPRKMRVDFSENEEYFIDGRWYISPEDVKIININ